MNNNEENEQQENEQEENNEEQQENNDNDNEVKKLQAIVEGLKKSNEELRNKIEEMNKKHTDEIINILSGKSNKPKLTPEQEEVQERIARINKNRR